MSIGVDGDLAAVLLGETQVEVVEIRASRAGVVFDRDAELCGAPENDVDVERVGIATEDLSPGRVAEYPDMRVFECAQNAIRHLLDRLVEA